MWSEEEDISTEATYHYGQLSSMEIKFVIRLDPMDLDVLWHAIAFNYQVVCKYFAGTKRRLEIAIKQKLRGSFHL